jgi:hypothetical protein
VVVLGIVARIPERRVDPNEICGLPHGRGEVGGVPAWADPGHRPEDKVRVGVEAAMSVGQARCRWPLHLTPEPEVGTDVARLAASGVRCRDRCGIDQAAPASAPGRTA